MVISIETQSCMSVSRVTRDEYMPIIIIKLSTFHAFVQCAIDKICQF